MQYKKMKSKKYKQQFKRKRKISLYKNEAIETRIIIYEISFKRSNHLKDSGYIIF